jgi:hypothetical protein
MVLSPPAGISATAVEDAAAAEGLRLVVRALEAEGRRDARGLAWFTGPARVPAPQREMYPEGKYDLGMAHGAAGVIAFLALSLLAALDGYSDRSWDRMLLLS